MRRRQASVNSSKSTGTSRSQSKDLSTKPKKRRANLYDAVAGIVVQSGFLTQKTKDQKRATQILRPDEVLFKRKRAPARYEESDYYFAHRALAPDQELPNGDLLVAVHDYLTWRANKRRNWRLVTKGRKKFTNRGQVRGRANKRQRRERQLQMDGTVLMALGVLVDEATKEKLGETGDLALIEATMGDEERAFAADA